MGKATKLDATTTTTPLGETMERKRHRSDTSAERKIADGEDTDAKGRTMADPAELLEIYRNGRGEETTLVGHNPREKGARPYFEKYTVWYEGHLVAVAETRSTAGELARALRSSIPSGTRGELVEDRNRLMSVAKYLVSSYLGGEGVEDDPENVAHMTKSELKNVYETREDRPKTTGVGIDASDLPEAGYNDI